MKPQQTIDSTRGLVWFVVSPTPRRNLLDLPREGTSETDDETHSFARRFPAPFAWHAVSVRPCHQPCLWALELARHTKGSFGTLSFSSNDSLVGFLQSTASLISKYLLSMAIYHYSSFVILHCYMNLRNLIDGFLPIRVGRNPH